MNFDFKAIAAKQLVWDPKRWPNFTNKLGEPESWMICKETGLLCMNPVFLDKLQDFRVNWFPYPMIGTSGYRHPSHPVEARKTNGPGAHSTGRAADFAVSYLLAFKFAEAAFKSNLFTGIGINQKGSGRFIHLDDIDEGWEKIPRPRIWSY